jgi:hypothetical protein
MALVLLSVLGIVWLARTRSTRRFHAVWNAYAQREIERERRWKRPWNLEEWSDD